MKYRGVPACSIELNPYLHFVGTVKTRTYAISEQIEGLPQHAFRRGCQRAAPIAA